MFLFSQAIVFDTKIFSLSGAEDGQTAGAKFRGIINDKYPNASDQEVLTEREAVWSGLYIDLDDMDIIFPNHCRLLILTS